MPINRVSQLLNISYPIIQAGMVWCSGWKLAAAVSNAGALGLIGAGSMYPDILREHIRKCKRATKLPFGVNLPLLYPDIDVLIQIIIEENVKIVFTSAGNPSSWTPHLKRNGIIVVHVVSSVKFAKKAQEAGVDAVVAEGFEAGGHNGREETTSLVLIPSVRNAIDIPLIAAGGFASGRSMLAAEVLGAEGIQVGTRFATAIESSAHDSFKQTVLQSIEGDTAVTLKQLTPVRLIKNSFYNQIREAELRGANVDELKLLLGKSRSKLGIFQGDLNEGELEIGQIASSITKIEPAANIVSDIWMEYQSLRRNLENNPTS